VHDGGLKLEVAPLQADTTADGSAELHETSPPRGFSTTPQLSVSPAVIEVELASRTPRHGIGNPAIDVGLPPASAVYADPDLGRERAFDDLAVDGGPGEASPSENGFQADDTVWCVHSCAASCRLFLTAPDPKEQTVMIVQEVSKRRRSVGYRRRKIGGV
jgi:hypothetical protein